MLKNSTSKLEKADITQMAFVIPTIKVNAVLVPNRQNTTPAMAMKPIGVRDQRASKKIIMQNATL